MFNYVRVAAGVPSIRVCDVDFNTNEIIKKIDEVIDNKPDIISFGELSITGYTCGDLFFQKTLQSGVLNSLKILCQKTNNLDSCLIVGAPLVICGKLFNCAVVINKGKVCGIVPKTIIPNHNNLCEKRWFSSSIDLKCDEILSSDIGILEDYRIPCGKNLIFKLGNDINFGIEIGDDLYSAISPSTELCLNGAELIINLSASCEVAGGKDFRLEMVKSQSVKNICDYVLVSTGKGESTSDLVYSGDTIIFENGEIIFQNKHLCDGDYIKVCDLDLGKIKASRIKNTSFGEELNIFGIKQSTRFVFLNCDTLSDGELLEVKKSPFIPENKEECIKKCIEIFEIQSAGLAKRVEVTNAKMVVGVSGGLDSTLALLVCAYTAKKLNKPLENVVGITMPCFGTTGRTYNNSIKLMSALGVVQKEINIADACLTHFRDLGHDVNICDLTYENTQARERTQVLMDYAGKIGGFVVGTGDLSELALGWCTYNGDHMSMYGVNSSIPKTLLKSVIESIIVSEIFVDANEVLKDIVNTPISPELLPPDESGNILQQTEDIVGPYELHDFFLYYVLRYGYEPLKIFDLAKRAFKDEFDESFILKWLKNFYIRFFTQQFKRNCVPDGVRAINIGLSPRGDWKMPSDASFKLWIDEIEKIR